MSDRVQTASVTMAEIASQAGVSKATVSRSLAGSSLIGKEVREKIESIATELGYQRRTVKRPAERSILTIKLILPPITNRTARLFYSFTDLVTGLQDGLTPAGMNLVVETNGPDYNPFSHKKSGEVEGFVFAFHRPSPKTLTQIKAAGSQAIVLNRSVRGLPCVLSDHAHAMDLIAEHLREKNITKNCTFITYSGIKDVSSARLKGFTKAAKTHGIQFDPERDLLSLDEPSSLTPQHLINLHREGTRTIIGVNDIIASLLVQNASQAGLKTPQDLRITGCDNGPSRNITVPLPTSVDLSIRRLAEEAGRHLCHQIVENTTPQLLTLVKGTLLPGHTT